MFESDLSPYCRYSLYWYFRGGITNGIAGGGRRYCRNSGKGGRGFHFWRIDRDFLIFQKFCAFKPPHSGPPEAARRLRRLPVGGPPQGEKFSDLGCFSRKINDFLVTYVNILMFFQSYSTPFLLNIINNVIVINFFV